MANMMIVTDAFGNKVSVNKISKKGLIASPQTRQQRKQLERDISLFQMNCVIPKTREAAVRAYLKQPQIFVPSLR